MYKLVVLLVVVPESLKELISRPAREGIAEFSHPLERRKTHKLKATCLFDSRKRLVQVGDCRGYALVINQMSNLSHNNN